MVQYAINHFVANASSGHGTPHGDDSLHIWMSGTDPTKSKADHVVQPPSDGWTWKTDESGIIKHPDALSQYTSSSSTIKRLSPWNTVLTNGYSK